MSEKIRLKGIAWDHPRGYEPLRATSKVFSEMYKEVNITWDIRSLKEFGDMPIEDLIDRYDLITIDHPYMGQAYTNKLLLNLQERLPEVTLKKLKQQSVGASFKSYYYKNQLLALPIDAAAQVAAARNDLLSALNLSLPKTREELFEFYKILPEGYTVAWPLCPTDIWCSFLTLCAQDSNGNFIKNQYFDVEIGAAVLNELKKHIAHLHTKSLNWNPIDVLDQMAADSGIIYSPFLFGYTNYSREGYAEHIVNFMDSPHNPEYDVSTILGGVGLAVSAKCAYPQWAISYAEYVSSEGTQTGIFAKNGGQPANLVAWQDNDNNGLCSNFFRDTLKTMQRVYVRPRHNLWNLFQEKGAEILHEGLVNMRPSEQIMKELNDRYKYLVKYER